MDRHDERDLTRDPEDVENRSTVDDGESHATTGGAAAAGAVTGGVIGLTGGPIGAAIGAVGGAIVGAAAERMMHSDDDAERAEAGLDNDRDRNPLIEDRAEADAHSRDMTSGAMDTTSDRPTATTRPTETSYDTARPSDAGERMQLREEQLHARTTPVETGHVSAGKDIVEEQRTIDVPVTREEAFVERRPVERRPSDQPIGESERNVDMPVYEERATAEKQPVVYEEVGIGKRQVNETQRVSDTVRREEARVETEGEANARKSDNI